MNLPDFQKYQESLTSSNHILIVFFFSAYLKLVKFNMLICLFSISFLQGKPPSFEKPTHNYPHVVQPNHDRNVNVLVVQAHHYLKYVGLLEVTFDDDGNLKEWNGNPILLDRDVVEGLYNSLKCANLQTKYH